MSEKAISHAQKHLIAQLAYREIEAVVEKYELHYGVKVNCHWNRHITVDGTDFDSAELTKKYIDDILEIKENLGAIYK